MDSKSLKYIVLLFFVNLDYGHPRDSLVVECRFRRDCDKGEYCDEYTQLCRREVIRQSDYRTYSRDGGDGRKRTTTNDLYLNQDYYQRGYDIRDGSSSGQADSSEWFVNKDEPMEEYEHLRPFLPVDVPSDNERRGEKGGPLPPSSAENWDKINAKHGQRSQEHDQDDYESIMKDYENLKLREHIRRGEDSSHRITHGVNDQQDSLQNSNYILDNDIKNEDSHLFRDSVNENVDLSHKKSEVLNADRGVVSSLNGNKGVPPIPFSRETAPDPSDKFGFQGNHLQTEKQAAGQRSVDIKAGEGKVMVKGKVKPVKADIDQGPNPEKTYKRVEDFFQSQRESSIVEVPSAVKKEEASKLFKENFIPVKDASDEVNKKQEDIDSPEEGNIKLSLNKKIRNSNVKLRMAQTKYTLEKPGDVAKRIEKEPSVKDDVMRDSGLEIKAADFEEAPGKKQPNRSVETQHPKYFLLTVIVVGCVTGVVLTAVAIYLMMRRQKEARGFKPVTLPGQEAAADYQELCRQLRATQGWDNAPVSTTPFQHSEKEKGLGAGRTPKYSWSEEPVVPNMDISTGHVVLSYMEDHLKNKDRLNKEWEALKTYEAEPNSTETGKLEKNVKKNRYSDVLPYDHNRVLLKETASASGTDYINASYIRDHDPKNPSYIATQGPLAQTVSDFWQMVWEQGVVVIVNLTKLSDLGLPQCHRYWPEEQQPIVTYRIYEVHLVSEHIWCEDYLVRSFYLKNLQTSETRTVTQFHFLSWPDLNVPVTPKPLLEFRRKVNKCFRGRASPVVVHCSGGVGRTGTYILIDMVLNKMMRGAKEIDIAATVEHLRDQRPSMVKTKAQFEFALTAVAEEVNAILQALAK
ncbi:receptor-type tyrosine-protein phosphatase N2-like isoform X2 [Montipora foliosa]|uniref:receptor-type tyrosine-protein phosphatase N2-like isoform X2 n=1 Tax=Montipora foliosa TaxID=591990 RepID=UPI0035F142CA